MPAIESAGGIPGNLRTFTAPDTFAPRSIDQPKHWSRLAFEERLQSALPAGRRIGNVGMLAACGLLTSLLFSSFAVDVHAQTAPSIVGPGGVARTEPVLAADGSGGDGATPYDDYSKRIKSSEQVNPLADNMFGDSYSPYLGTVEFENVDIDIPGNSALPVQLRRRFVVQSLPMGGGHDSSTGAPGNYYGGMGNWEIEVPYISGVFSAQYGWTNPSYKSGGASVRCSNAMYPGVPSPFSVNDVLFSPKIHIPGIGDKDLVRDIDNAMPTSSTGNGLWTTKDFDAISCTPTDNGSGEGFVLTTKDGVSYTFNHYVTRAYPALAIGKNPNTGQPNKLGRTMIFLLATQVKDSHGNTVTYEYNTAPGLPSAIYSSDQRRIDFTYNQVAPWELTSAQVSAHQSSSDTPRVWHYNYTTTTNGNFDQLTTVTLPDQSTWGYVYSNSGSDPGSSFPDGLARSYDYLYVQNVVNDGSPCNAPPFPGGSFKLQITHPSGSAGTFVFDFDRHDRTVGVSNGSSCVYDTSSGMYHLARLGYADAFSLTYKTIKDTSTSASTWSYEYDPAACGTNITRISLPDNGGKVESTFSDYWGATSNVPRNNTCSTTPHAIEGSLLSTTTYSASGTVLRSTSNTYVMAKDSDAWSYAFPVRAGGEFIPPDDDSTLSLRPLLSTSTNQQGTTFTRSNLASSFDAYARPTQYTLSSSPACSSCSRDEKVTFKDDTAKWVLGLLDTKQVKGAGQPTWITALDNDYDPLTLDLTKVTEFGVPKRTMTYYTDGTLHTVNDGLNTTTLGTFKRGIPQSVSYADGSQSATIDDVGEITSITDELGNTTNYHYDPAGRLDTITHPADVVSWYPTSILYEQVATTEAGISGLHWRQTRTTGNPKQITYYDQRLRPIVTQEYDAADATTTRYTRRGFDFANRSTFVSYPATSVSPTAGTHTTYDALGRTLTTTADSELGSLTTTTTYSPTSFQTTTTDPRGAQTTTTYQAFDEPSYDAPLVTTAAVGQPEQQATTVARDLFGKPTSITRSGTYGGSTQSLTRSYVYDSGQRLCKTVDPETQATIQAYDAAGNVSWSLKGSTLTSLSSCDNASAPSGATSYTYDGRNRLTNTDYPSSTSDIANTYYADGSLKTTMTNGATWTYAYNKLHLPTSETLSYDGQTYALGWQYDRNASIKTLTYPDQTPIDYAPNALGQPTKAAMSTTNYASNVAYYPNGAMSGFTYGNGVVHSMSQNARKLPSRSWDAKPATGAVTDLTYTYDANANVTAITDGTATPTETRSSITYDKLNRLTGVTASLWGTATYAYDALDNLRMSAVGSIRSCTHNVDSASNRLTSLSGTGCAISYTYDTANHGNVVQRGTQAFTWDGADRLTGATGKESYTYDGLGHRVGLKRTADNSTLYQVYSKAGDLLFAFDTKTGVTSDYVMLNGSLIARLDGTLGGNVPAVPSAPTVSPAISTSGAYTVSWTGVSGATGYVLLRSVNGGTAVPVSGSPITATSWPESGKPSGAYTYTLEACNGACSAPSTGTTEKVLLAPTSLSSTSYSLPENTAYTVSWSSVITATSYQLDENSGSGWSSSTVSGTSKTFSKPAGSYQYRVHACISPTCSGASATITVAVNQAAPPPIPQNVTVSPTNSTDGNFTVQWTASTGASTYKVREYYNLNTVTDIAMVSTTSWSPNPAKTVSGSYRYTVFACNSANACSNESVGATVTVSLPVSLGVPTGLQACTGPGNANCQAAGSGVSLEVLKNKTYTVSWNAVTDATNYNLKEVKTPSCGSVQTTTASVTTTSKAFSASVVTCSGTEMSVSADYTVQACTGTNCGGWTSASVTVESVPVLAREANIAGVTSVTYVHTDALHSSVVETDSTGAAKTGSRPKYEAYGAPTTGYTQGPGYTGHVMDATTQLVYMQQRYYDPMKGGFLSTDPVTANFNRYAYANNSPYRKIDPDGRQPLDVGSIAGMHPSARREVESFQINHQAEKALEGSVAGLGTKALSDTQRALDPPDQVKQLVKDHVSVNAKGVAAAGTGIQVTKNLANGNDSVGWVPVGEGLYAGLNADVRLFSIDFSGGKSSPVTIEISGDFGAGPSVGGSVNVDPAGKLSVYVSYGIGLGEQTSFSPKLNAEINK